MPTSLALQIKPQTDLHRKLVKLLRDRVQFSKQKMSTYRDRWKKAEENTLAYLPEKETDAKRRVSRDNEGKPQYTTIVVPYTYGILMASHTYWTTVFMARNPVMQFTGRHGESQQQVQAVEAIMDYQASVGQMMVPWYIWLLDVGKYGLGVLGNYWDKEEHTISKIEEYELMIAGTIPTGVKRKRKITEHIPGYEGNKVYNVRPQDFFPDPRVTLANFQKGEFCACYTELGWDTILERQAQGYYHNIKYLEKYAKGGELGAREQGSAQLELPDDTGMSPFDFSDQKASSVIKAFEVYVKIIPEQWGLGSGKMPEKWVFTITSDYQLIIGCQPLGAYHNKFPFFVIEYEPEGYALVNRGLPELVQPIQNTMDWLINSHFYNVRKVLNDQFVVDPSRVVMKDLLDPLPGGLIRLKPEAYGTDTKTALTQLTVNDVTQNHLRDMQMMFGIGERAHGVNDQIMGVLQRGGRKTATEVRTSSTFGVNRLKTSSEYFSAMGWAPMTQMMLQNTQQFYDADKKFKIAGDLALDAMQFMQVRQDDIQGFYDFVPVDGTLPVDRFAQANLWKELLGQLRNFPQIMMQYDMGRIFSWVAQLAGLKNITQFKIQLAGPGAIQQQVQAGNLIPQPPGGGPMPTTKQANLNEPAQVPMMGPTG